MQIQAFDWLSVWQFSAQLSSFLSLQYLKFSEVIWFLRRNSCKIIILFWHFPYQKQNLFRKLFLLLLLSPIDSKLSNPYTKHVYLNIMFFNISLLGFALKMMAHFTGWGYFWTFSRFLGILGIIWIIQKLPVGKAQMTLELFNTSDWNSDWKNNQLYVT